MARPADPLKAAAITDLIKHLESDADIELVRPRYATINKVTWWRWVQEAKAIHAKNQGEKPPAKRAKKPKGEAPKTGDFLPATPGTTRKQRGEKPAGDDDDAPGVLGGVSPDGLTYITMTMFGPKESSIVGRWVEKPELDPHKALAILDRLGEQYLNAEALMKASIKSAGDGHAILDPVAFATSVDLMRKILVDQFKVMRESRNLDSVQRFIEAVVERLRQESPEVALPLIKVLRDAAQPFTKTLWRPSHQTMR